MLGLGDGGVDLVEVNLFFDVLDQRLLGLKVSNNRGDVLPTWSSVSHRGLCENGSSQT